MFWDSSAPGYGWTRRRALRAWIADKLGPELDRKEGDDVNGETHLKLSKSERFTELVARDHNAVAMGYATTTAWRECQNCLRRRRRAPNQISIHAQGSDGDAAGIELASREVDPLAWVQSEELRTDLSDCLERLQGEAPELAEAVAAFLLARTQREAAEAIQLSPGGFSHRWSQSLGSLRYCMKSKGHEIAYAGERKSKLNQNRRGDRR